LKVELQEIAEPTFNKHHELLMRNLGLMEMDLEDHKESEEEAILLKERSLDKLPDFQIDSIENNAYSFLRIGPTMRELDRGVKKIEELSQRCLVHDIDLCHLNDQEVEDTPATRYWTELISRDGNL
jgi:hypothetical protein